MITEGYFAKLKTYPENELLIVVSKHYPHWVKRGYAHHPELAPSDSLLAAYKKNKIGWDEYEARFRLQIMMDGRAQTTLKALKTAGKYDSLRLLCYERGYPCHRFILLKIIEEMKK